MDTNIYKQNKTSNLIITSSLQNLALEARLEKYPTALLIGNSENFTHKELNNIFSQLVELGLTSIMLWGKNAIEQEDFLDLQIEISEQDLTHIITTAYTDDSIEEIAYFFLNSTYFDDNCEQYQFIAILKGDIDEIADLKENISLLYDRL